MPEAGTTSRPLRAHFPSLAGGTAYFDGPGGTQTPDVVGEAMRRRDHPAAVEPRPADPRRAQRRRHRAGGAGRAGRPAGRRPGGRGLRAEHDAADVRHLARDGEGLGAGRRDRRHQARPRRQRAAVGDRGGEQRRDGAVGGVRPGDGRARPVGRHQPADRGHPARRGHGRVEPDRHPARPADDRGGGARGGRAAVRRRRALTPRTSRPTWPSWAPTSTRARPTSSSARTAAPSSPCPSCSSELHPDKLVPATDAVPERFELGTLPYELMAGTTAAVDFLPRSGRATTVASRLRSAYAAIERYEDGLRERLEEGLADLPVRRALAGARGARRRCWSPSPTRDAAEVSVALADRDINAPASNFYAWEASHHLGLGDAGGLRIGLAPYIDRGRRRPPAGRAGRAAGLTGVSAGRARS